MRPERPQERPRWLDQPRNVDRIFWGLVLACAGLGLVDLLLHKHAHFSWEAWPDFHGLFGFVACVLLVLAAKQLRRILMRGEDYYDR